MSSTNERRASNIKKINFVCVCQNSTRLVLNHGISALVKLENCHYLR